MALPPIDFAVIAQTAKDAIVSYGTPAIFYEGTATTGRAIKVVVYKDDTPETLQADADSMPATAILNPDDFATPYRSPRKFDKIKVELTGFVRTYTIESVSPIAAQNTLPLLLVQLRAN
jgi:hypothetical protein